MRFNKLAFGLTMTFMRNKYQVSMADAARQSGISYRAWHAMESGRSAPSIEVLLALAALFNCKTDELFDMHYQLIECVADIQKVTGASTHSLRQQALQNWIAKHIVANQ